VRSAKKSRSGFTQQGGRSHSFNKTLTPTACKTKSKYEEHGFLGCNVMQFAESPRIQRNILPPSSGSKCKPIYYYPIFIIKTCATSPMPLSFRK
jgi:hypothetical protein